MQITKPLYQRIAVAIDARTNCEKSGNDEWFQRWTGDLEEIGRNRLPSGSGFDSGSTIDLGRSTGDRIVISTSFHHMDDAGGYDGWTDHDVIVTASMIFGVKIRVTGRNRNDIKEYIHECFEIALCSSDA